MADLHDLVQSAKTLSESVADCSADLRRQLGGSTFLDLAAAVRLVSAVAASLRVHDCPWCHRQSQTQCRACRGTGRLTEQDWAAVPDEVKERIA